MVALVVLLYIYGSGNVFLWSCREHCVHVCVCVFFKLLVIVLFDSNGFVLLKKKPSFFLELVCTVLLSFSSRLCNCLVYIDIHIIYNCVCLCVYLIYCKGFVTVIVCFTHFLSRWERCLYSKTKFGKLAHDLR